MMVGIMLMVMMMLTIMMTIAIAGEHHHDDGSPTVATVTRPSRRAALARPSRGSQRAGEKCPSAKEALLPMGKSAGELFSFPTRTLTIGERCCSAPVQISAAMSKNVPGRPKKWQHATLRAT